MLPFVNYNHWTGPVDWTDGLGWWNGLVDCKSDTYPEQFHTENPSLLHWLVSLLYFPTESPWGMRRMKI